MNVPPTLVISMKSFVPILISSTPPSKPTVLAVVLASRSYRCRNESCMPLDGTNTGDTRSDTPILFTSAANAPLGGVSTREFVVRQLTSAPDDAVAQFVGNAGAV